MTATPTKQKLPASNPAQDLHVAACYSVLSKGIPLYKTRGFSKEQMDEFYARGYNLYSAEKYEEAGKIFRALTFFNHVDTKSWLGAAGCAEMLKDYEKALIGYSYAAILEPSNPMPSLHAFDCHLALKNYPQALSALDSVMLRASKKPEHAAIKKRAEVLRDALHKTIQEGKKA